MTERRYLLAEAAADLRDAGLLANILVHERGEWSTLAKDTDSPGGAFLGASLDSRSVTVDSLFLALPGERVDGRNYVGVALRAGSSAALTSEWGGAGPDPLMSGDPGRDAVVLVATNPHQALTVLAERWRSRLGTKAVAVTGSNGKTTTKDLLSCLLNHHGSTHATVGNYNNDLGLPLTILGLRECHRWAVLELGASAPGDIDRLAALAKPQVGVITNAAGAHLDGFGNLEGVIATKGELLDHLPSDGTAVLDRDGIGYDSWRDRAPCRIVDWGLQGQRGVWTWQPTGQGAGGVVSLDQESWTLPLPGRHNGANLIAAVLAARALTGETLDIAAALTQFSGSSHRNHLLDAAGVTLFDDSYNANPASVLAAAEALMDLPGQGRRFAVLGMMAELGTESLGLHHETGAALRELGLDGLWSVGESALGLAAGFADAGGNGEALQDVDTALHTVLAAVEPGDIILVKGSRSAGMEKFVSRFLQHRNPDMKNLETS